jgi:hypothetical protein
VSPESEARGAGAYAYERYTQGRSSYRVKARPVFLLGFGPFIVAGSVFLFIEGHPYTWAAGLVTGALATAWLLIRDEHPAYVENWREGAEGERMTAEALKPLQESGLNVVHDVQMQYGNYDHIAVGPSGVFLLETKNPNGIVELRDGVPHLQRRHDSKADNRDDRVRRRALSAAWRLHSDLEQRTGHRIWVQAVVVYWSDFPEGLVDDGRCIFIHGPRLEAWMRDRPEKLDQVKVDKITAAVLLIGDHEPIELDSDSARK